MLNRFFSLFDVKNNSAKLYRFTAVSFSFTFVLLLAFIAKAGAPDSIFGFLYSLLVPIYYYLIFAVIMTLLLPIIWLRRALFIMLIPKVIIDTLLLADFITFDVYRFHIDMLFINMAIHDFAGLGVSNGLIALAIVVVILIFIANFLLFKYVDKFGRFSVFKFNALLFLGFIVSQLIHIVGYEYKHVEVTKYTPYVPYYLPITAHSKMVKLQAKYPSIFPEKTVTDESQLDDILAGKKASGLVKYPLKPLVCEPAVSRERNNILLFVVESWREDAMNEEVTPNIYQFAQQNTQFDNHFSGGSVTVNGLFSLMYGLHPVYRDHMSSAPFENQTLLTKTLAAQGYEVKSYTASNLDRFSLKEMFFGNISDENYFYHFDKDPSVSDTEIIKQVINDINTPSAKPWFKFVFLTATHFSYRYPKEFEKYKPIPKNSEAFLFDKNTDSQPYFNDYHNSVLYMDKLFGDLWQAVETSGLADNTMAIVTSDHGEEFNDNKVGYWGHGSNFTQYQVKVPLILKQAKNTKVEAAQYVSTLSGHIDVVPTIFKQELACQNPVQDFSNGENLLALPATRPGIISASYKDKAYIIDDIVYATGLSIESYYLNDLKIKNTKFNYGKLNKLKAQEYSFLKE